MVVRSWKGNTTAGNAESYTAHLRRAVIRQLERIDGFRGIRVLRRANDSGYEFMVLTFWDSMEIIEQFAGQDIEAAVVPPEAQAVLSRFDTKVCHYDVVIEGD